MNNLPATPDPASADDSAFTNHAGQFVRVYHDKGTGRTVIALDRAATDALFDYLDNLDIVDLSLNAGAHGLDQDQGDAQSAALSSIRGALSKLMLGL